MTNYEEEIRKVIQVSTMSINNNPNSSEAYTHRALAKAELKEFKGAIEDFNKAIEINPNDSETYIFRGNTKAGLNDYKGAIEDFNKAITINPNDMHAYNHRGLAKRNLSDFLGAIEDYNKAITINPNDAHVYTNRSVAKRDIKDFNGVISDCDKAIDINPNNANTYMMRGVGHHELGNFDEARLDWLKAGELGYTIAYELIEQLIDYPITYGTYQQKYEDHGENFLYYCHMVGYVIINCKNCGFNKEIVCFRHGHGSKEDIDTGFQCQKCGAFYVIKNDIYNSKNKKCSCGGILERKKPLFCPICRSKNLTYEMM